MLFLFSFYYVFYNVYYPHKFDNPCTCKNLVFTDMKWQAESISVPAELKDGTMLFLSVRVRFLESHCFPFLSLDFFVIYF